jgi:hypothetical protein
VVDKIVDDTTVWTDETPSPVPSPEEVAVDVPDDKQDLEVIVSMLSY